MSFKKYQHLERKGTVSVHGIENGVCHIFPKLDGTNGSIWRDSSGAIKTGSRNRELTEEKDNAGFCAYVNANLKKFQSFFIKNPDVRLYGEWLVPHTIKTYKENAWRKFYIFDVLKGENYMTYDEYRPLLETHQLDYIPLLKTMDHPTGEQLKKLTKNNRFLIEEKDSIGEGLVLKRYGYVNRFERTQWAKIISREFDQIKNPKLKRTEYIFEHKMMNKCLTESFIDKCFAKMTLDEEWNPKRTGKFLMYVYEEFIIEELTNFVIKENNAKLDFRALRKIVFDKARNRLQVLIENQ